MYVLSFGAWVAFAAEHLRRIGRRPGLALWILALPFSVLAFFRPEVVSDPMAGALLLFARLRVGQFPFLEPSVSRREALAGPFAALVPFFGIAVFRHMGEAFRVMAPTQALLLIVVLDRRSVFDSDPDIGAGTVAVEPADVDGAVDPRPV